MSDLLAQPIMSDGVLGWSRGFEGTSCEEEGEDSWLLLRKIP